MAINETRLQTALDKIANKRNQARDLLNQYEEILKAIMSIRQITVEDFDVDGNKTGTHTELPEDPLTQDIVSLQRRQEIYDKIVTMIEALP